MKAALTLGLSVAESRIAPAGLDRFDGAFVTNSVIEALPVCRIGNTDYETPEIIKVLQEGYRTRVEASLFAPQT